MGVNDAPVAFLSYVRFDDEHDNGRLTEFRERLSREVRIQTGQSFEIFQDRKDIAWGEQWLSRIEGTLQSVTFFIPVITPTFFASAACRDELALFLEHEARLRRSDLILPVYYVECARLSDKEQCADDPLAQALAERQFFDWRAYRFEPFTAPAVGKSFESMARQIRAALGQAPRKPFPNESPRGSVEGSRTSSWQERLKQTALQAPMLIVDAIHRGHYATIGQAIQAAKPGSRIMVRPGLYREGVVINKPLELIGDGDRADIVIEAIGTTALLFQATMGRVSNLTLRQAGDGNCYCVEVAQGRLDLEDCDLSSESLACVAIHNNADPRLRRNRIHDGKQAGVFCYENGQGILEENEIFANALAGVQIKGGANPTLRRNRLFKNKLQAVVVREECCGTLEENDLRGSTKTWFIDPSSKSKVVLINNLE